MTDDTNQKRPMRPVYTASPSRDFLDSFLKDSNKETTQGDDKCETAQKVAETTASEGDITPVVFRDTVIEMLQSIYDPEIPVNLYDLGLIYDVNVDDKNNVHINMTLTTPHCPVAETMPGEVQTRVMAVENVGHVSVELVWEPPWDMSRMSEEARLELGFI